ncbi:Type I restriction modification DNA specificity domain protein [Apilactobacillus kunkeei]|uniref:restriction endonuclease subunit S n=1 Tax=Apilactobacillus kunkeei TaxID=148814 RepID=UPI0006B250E0|nr:restriction endonuclease subunit S [Apilactobacillus kunkeei]KOY78255.1 Type I restriction modification DNA specificity domain protein [Apilactobacillus kunkeei]
MAKTNVPRLRFKEFDGEWKFGHLSDVGLVKMNKRIHKNETKDTGDVPFFKIGTFGKKPDAFITRNRFLELKEHYPYPKPGDILMSASGTLGRTVVYEGKDEYFQDSNIIWLDLNNKEMINIFLLQFYKQHIWKSEGTTIKRLYNKDIYSTSISYPSVYEQKKIGTFFAKIDEIIELQTQKLEQLKKLKRGYLQKMFPQDGESLPRLRFSGFSDKWNEVKIGKIMDVGSVFRIHQRDWRKEGVPFIRARDIVSYLKQGHFSNDRIFISEDKYKEMIEKSGNANKGDMLVTGVGTIGIPFLIRTDEPLYFKDGNIIWLKNNNVVNPNFLFYNFLTPFVQDEIFSFSGVGTVATYTIESAKKTMLMLPTNSEQQQIGKFFSKLDQLINNQSKKIEDLKQQKKSYLQKIFI